MNHSGVTLSRFFERHRDAGQPLVLATIAETIGSTYRKPGAQMLIAGDGSAAGLLSGGCLEADLMDRAQQVLTTGTALIVEYDTRSSDDILWGIGLGCEGAMRIILTRIDAENGYQPFAHVEASRHANVPARFAIVVASANPAYPLGAEYRDASRPLPDSVAHALGKDAARRSLTAKAQTVEADGATFLIVPIALPVQLLLLGAGPDTMPVVEMAAMLDWHVTVVDHRPAYASASRFPQAKRVVAQPVAKFSDIIDTARYDAAVVMSHHLISDAGYLAGLARSDIAYIGLLGPAPRRVRLMTDIGDAAQQFGDRLHGPIGLDIGANSPESIALSIISEIQAVLAGRPGGSFGGK